jgi:zinc transport system permease protein
LSQALLDPLFRIPFLTGIAFALSLPLLGMYLRLREEWLAALAFAQLAAAGSLAAAIVGLPFQLGAVCAASLGATAKSVLTRTGNNGYAAMMIFGWAVAVLLLANVPVAEHLAHALFDGQLYFTDISHLAAAAGYLLVGGALLAALSRPLLLERMLPGFFAASGRSARVYHVGFDLLAAAGLALSTASIGVMAAFGLVFVPSMVAYRIGPNWQASLALAAGVGLASYVLAFAIALELDQPFGPVLVLILVAVAGIALSLPGGGRRKSV